MTPQQRYYQKNKPRAAAWREEWRTRHKERTRELNREYYARRVAWLQELKLQRGCKDCGYQISPVALQFDHVIGVKAFTISGAVKLSKDRLVKEIAKCEVVCANCHAIREQNRRKGINNAEAI